MIAVLSIAILSGCAVGPNFEAPQSPLTTTNILADIDYGAQANANNDGTVVPWNWWSIINDPVLAQLEATAQQGNLDLQSASSRIMQSRAALGLATSELMPTVSANGSYAREGLSENGHFAALGAPTAADNFWTSGLTASWELDFWGKNQRAQESAAATLEAAIYQREAIRVSLTADIANTYLLLRSSQAQLDIVVEQQQIAATMVELAKSRERNGVSTHLETITAQTKLATVTAQVPTLTQRRNALMNALALLVGEQPRALNTLLLEHNASPEFPHGVPVALPSDLAQQRPDILAAQARLHSAVAAIGVAEANFYPSVTLNGNIGVEGYDSSDLSSWDSRVFSVGPSIYLPIFQGGKLKRKLELTKQQQKSAALDYRQTVLQAWHDVDNAMDAWSAQQSHHEEIAIAHSYNQQALATVSRAYEQGVADKLSVLNAKNQLLQSQLTLNDSATSGSLAVVNLFKAVGRGWDNSAVVTTARLDQ
ncbi:efflux transporter outer membrane subunit [Ferrimonas lipolytica]|uniref:Efflux transporter outer membrane subunit n=2 Tax=Ferrimonas lipolytica TaxID=2724191 RepID=A0A6H1UM08_9GAMM|nr:efflux transporter outer membrane subunit [Ferrimonas lipolytica]